MNDGLLRLTGTRSWTSVDFARYVRTEYGDDDPTWLLSQNRAPKGARSFSPSPAAGPFTSLRRAARVVASMLL